MISRVKLLVLACSVLMVILLGSLYVLTDMSAKSIGTYVSALRPIARSIVWELDQEIPNVGKLTSAPLLELKLSRNDIAHFDELYAKFERDEDGQEFYTTNNSWRSAELRYNGEKYAIKIKSQGRAPTSHRKDQFISYTIKITGGKSIEGVTRFNLIIRERIQPQRLINMLMAGKFGLIRQNLQLVRVKINSWDEKLYFWEDRLSSKLMELRRNSSLNFFKTERSGKLNSDKSLIYSTKISPTGLDEEKEQNVFEKMFDAYSIDEKDRAPVFDRYMQLNRAITDSDYSNFHDFFTKDYISSFEAVRFLMGFNIHGFYWANLYVALNFSDGGYYPAIVRDHVQSYIRLKGNESIELKLDGGQTPLLRMLNRNDIVRQEKYKKAYHFIANDQQFLKEQRQVFEKYERLFYRGWLTQVLRKIRGDSFSRCYNHNRLVIKKYLEDSRPEVQFQLLGDKWIFKVSPHSMSALSLQSIDFTSESGKYPGGMVKVSLFKGGLGKKNKLAGYEIGFHVSESKSKSNISLNENELFTSLDEGLKKREEDYFFVIENQTGALPVAAYFSFLFKNSVTQADIAINKFGTLSLSVDQVENLLTACAYEDVSDLEAFVQRYAPLNFQILDNSHLLLPSGNYQIESDLILPRGVNLSVDRGTSISLGSAVSLIVRGGLTLRGTKDAPIHIQSIEEDLPFGTVGVLGDGSTKVRLEYLVLENGYEAWHEGTYFSGSLSLYHHQQVKIIHSSVSKGHADDGVNVKFVPDFTISDSTFSDNYADQVDLDYVLGEVSSSHFSKEEGDSNGDGLDVSGSNVLVKENIFTGFKDKGVSVGEDSRVYFVGNRLNNNRKGLAIKDSSIVYVGENTFQDNEVDVDLYRKKKIFHGGLVYLQQGDNEKLRLKKDKYSKIHQIEVAELELAEKGILTMEDRRRNFVGYRLSNGFPQAVEQEL